MSKEAHQQGPAPEEVSIQSKDKGKMPELESHPATVGPVAPIDPKDKGKLPMVKQDFVNITDIIATDPSKSLEVRVYRKWIARNVPDPTPTGLCFILLDREGNAVQANVEARDIKQFESSMEVNSCYRIYRFGSKTTENWQRTLKNDTTLLFGKLTLAVQIPDDGFAKHYFDFAAYNELAPRTANRESILTDYIGIIRNVSRIKEFGNATANPTLRKNIQIQNLNGTNITLSLWNEMAVRFEIDVATQLEQPIIIAVSSCIVKTFGGTLQLSGSTATSYYLNPDIPEANHIRAIYNELLGPVMPLTFETSHQQAVQQSSIQPPLTIVELMQITPGNVMQGETFIIEGVITKIEENMEWYMNRCKVCNRNIEDKRPHWHCEQSMTESNSNYSYCFRCVVADVTGSIVMSCFSPQAHSLLPPCIEVVSYISDRNPYILPPIIRDLENTKHRFKVHFGTGSRKGLPRLILDHADDPAPPLLPQIETEGSSSTAVIAEEYVPITELTAEILTPPPSSADTPEKISELLPLTTTSVKKQLFQPSPEDENKREAKKPKTD